MDTGIKVDVLSLPPLIPLWQAPTSSRRKHNVPTVADLLHVGKTTAFGLVKDGRIKVVRLSARKTLAVTSSVLALLESSIGTNGSEA